MAGITITEDESDKKRRQASELARELPERHKADTGMAEELAARSWQMDLTKIVSRKKVKAGASNTDPEPTHAHRLVDRRRDGEVIARRQGIGYEIVPEDDDTQLVSSSKKDGAQVQGDLVLMRIPVDKYEQHVAARRNRWMHMSGDRHQQAKDNLNKIARDGGLTGPHKNAAE